MKRPVIKRSRTHGHATRHRAVRCRRRYALGRRRRAQKVLGPGGRRRRRRRRRRCTRRLVPIERRLHRRRPRRTDRRQRGTQLVDLKRRCRLRRKERWIAGGRRRTGRLRTERRRSSRQALAERVKLRPTILPKALAQLLQRIHRATSGATAHQIRQGHDGGGSGGSTSADDGYRLQTRRTQRTTPSAPAETMVCASSQTAAFTPPA